MKERFEKGDIVQAIKAGTIWFVEEVGGAELVQGRCVRQRQDSDMYPFGTTSAFGREVKPFNIILGQAVDFEHACAIVALLIG